MRRGIKHIETVNAMDHNAVTWERKQAVITQGLQLLSECLDTAVESIDVVEVMSLAKKAQDVASRALSMGR
jgi:diacylglycerol kinase